MQKHVLDNRSERLLKARDVYGRLGICRSKFYDMVRDGEFPSGVRITTQRVGWRESAVDDWINSLPAAKPTHKLAA
jgi:prophage regulatory protein